MLLVCTAIARPTYTDLRHRRHEVHVSEINFLNKLLPRVGCEHIRCCRGAEIVRGSRSTECRTDTTEVLEVSINVLDAALFEPTATVLLKIAGQLFVSC
jgi:hypothetical protein